MAQLRLIECQRCYGPLTQNPDGICDDCHVHFRESTTPMPEDGILLADCQCGATYSVPMGGDEFGALEEARQRHIVEANQR